jgi:hypothetical protein
VGCNTILILLFFGIWIFSSVIFYRVAWYVLPDDSDLVNPPPAPSSIDSDSESDASDSEKAEIKVLQPGKREGSSERVKCEGSPKRAKIGGSFQRAKRDGSSQRTERNGSRKRAQLNGSRRVSVPPGKCECFGCSRCRGANEGQCTRSKRLGYSRKHCHSCHITKIERNKIAIALKLDLNCRAECKCPKCDQVFESSELFLYHFQSAHWFQFIEDQNISCIDCGISARHAIFIKNGPCFTKTRCVECNTKRGYEGTKKLRRCKKGQTGYDAFVQHEGLFKAKLSDIGERW